MYDAPSDWTLRITLIPKDSNAINLLNWHTTDIQNAVQPILIAEFPGATVEGVRIPISDTENNQIDADVYIEIEVVSSPSETQEEVFEERRRLRSLCGPIHDAIQAMKKTDGSFIRRRFAVRAGDRVIKDVPLQIDYVAD